MKTSNMRSHLWFSTVYNETNMCSVFGDIKTSNDIFDKVQDFFKRSWSIFFYTSWSIDNKSEVGLGFTFYDERRGMESWRSTTKYIIDASGYRFPLPINNLQFSFPNLIIFLKLAECALSIDSESYCLMSDFFCSIQLLLGCSRDLSINQSFSFQFTNYLG